MRVPPGLLVITSLAAAGVACDPVDHITIRFPTRAGDTVAVYWVKTFEGRTYADGRIDRLTTTGPELEVTHQECCGTAAAYRAGELWFLACAQGPSSEATLTCGKVGDPAARLTHAALHDTTCDAIDATVGRMDVDLRACALTPARPAPSR